MYHFETNAIHAGQEPDPQTGAVVRPLSLATTFAQPSPGKPIKYDYSRSNNPSRESFEQCIAALEGAKYCLAFASGLAATTTMLHTLKPGDHIVSVDDVYGGTQRYFNRVAATFGLEFSYIEFDNLEKSIIPGKTKFVWLETPTNPTMKISDIENAAKISKQFHCTLIVDNTFMSPYGQHPMQLGADISFNSVSKYINGHSDVIMGCVCLNDEALYTKLKFLQNSLGAIPSPFDCYLALRGVKTLAIRMKQHEQNALQVAKFLEAHPKVRKVLYPGLPSHPQHEIAKKQNTCFGGMVSFYLRGGIEESTLFLSSCKLFTLAESLGAVESLIQLPSRMTHASVPPEVRAKLGIDDSLIRVSVGIENVDDLIADLSHALDAVKI